MINQIGLDYQYGVGGIFLYNFLDPDIKLTKAEFYEDHPKTSIVPVLGDGHRFKRRNGFKEGKFTVGLGYTNIKDFIKHTVIDCVRQNIPIDQIDAHLIALHDTPMEFFDVSNVSFMLAYEDLFRLDVMNNLYVSINGSSVPEYKIEYFKSYKDHHYLIFNSWQFKVIEKIFLFEYTHKKSAKSRNWSIDNIREDNWESFTEENLWLKNYH